MARQTNLEHRAVLLCRVLDALSDADALRSPDARVKVRSFLIRSTQKVIDHYRRVLSIHQMSDTDKNAILLRFEEQERALREWMRQGEERAIAHSDLQAA